LMQNVVPGEMTPSLLSRSNHENLPLKDMNMVMAGNVFPRKTKGQLPRAVKAEGIWITDQSGRRYIDASGGAVVVNLGHGRKEIAEAVFKQLTEGYYFHPTMFTTGAVEDLARALVRHAPTGIGRFYFLSSGSEAVEAAVKLARQIHLARGRPTKYKLISRWKSYHGLTLGALAAMGRTSFRTPYAPMLPEVVHIPPPYCLRCSFGLTHPECGMRCALALEEAIHNEGEEVVSAFLAEPVSGATIAACPPPPGYWKLIREICDRYQVLLIHDEVMTGMGRTGCWFAGEHYNVAPDIVTLGKGLSGGSLPLSAVGVQEALFESVLGAGGFVHGGTYSHHPVAAAAGLACITILEREGLVERAARMGAWLGEALRNRLAGLPTVADVRGMGMLWGVELVRDKAGLAPYPRSERVTERVVNALFEQGVIVYGATGLAGPDGDALVIAPPFIIEKKDLKTVIEAIGRAIEQTLSSA